MKSKKIISCLMAFSIVATSTLVCGIRVQAADIENNVKQESQIRSIIPVNQKFSVYYQCSSGLIKEVKKYITSSVHDNITPTSDGIRSILIANGVSKRVANNISFSLLDLAVKTEQGDVYPEEWFQETLGHSEHLILTNGNDEFCLVRADPSVKNYSLYAILTVKDLENVNETMKKNPWDKKDIKTYLQKMVLKSNLTQDEEMARKIGVNLYNLYCNGDSALKDFKKLDENFLILISDDNERVVITRQPR